MSARFRHEDVAAVPSGWKVRTVKAGSHRVRVAFPPGRKQVGSGRLVSVLHPLAGSNPCANPCSLRSTNPAELMVMSANNPPRRRRNAAPKPGVAERHQIKIAKQTLKMSDVGAQIMGGMTKPEAREVLRKYGIRFRENHRINASTLELKRAARVRAKRIREAAGHNPAELMVMAANPDDWERRVRAYERQGITRSDAQAIVDAEDEREHRKLVEAAAARRRENPRVEVVHGDNPPVEEIAEEFSGVDVKYIDVYNEPHIPRGRYAYLAKLYRLLIKPEKGGQVQRVTFNQSDPPLIVSDSTGKQIYFVGGQQDLTECLATFTDLRAFGDSGAVRAAYQGDLRVVLGQGREIHYIGKKHHIGDEDTDEWRHKHGEEDGLLPTVVFDAQNKRLLYEGGNYRIEGPWMHN